jgi:hypothetical protein
MASTGMNLFVAFQIFVVFTANIDCQEVCQSLFGGQVYPQETCATQSGQRSLGHSLQWSQAISMYPTRLECSDDN